MQVDTQPKRFSPLHEQHHTLGARLEIRGGWLVPEVYISTENEYKALQESAGLTDISSWGKLTLKGVHAGAVISASLGNTPTEVGVAIEIEPKRVLAAQLTADEFLILTPPGAEREIGVRMKAEISSQNSFVSLINQTSGLVGFSTSGPESTAVMRKLCAISFNAKDFLDMHLAQSSFAKVRATILRHDRDAVPTFELFADRSYGAYLWEAILDAGREFGIQPVGWEAMEG
jgi:heterotetrameric sarcosine oxidase gamma subunit